MYFFQELLREGLVNVLVDKVADFVKKNGRVHTENTEHMIPLEDRRQCDICNENGHFAFDSSKRYVECDKQNILRE
jgi:hypothetical protein